MATIADDSPDVHDRSTVSTSSEHDICYWCNRLKVSRAVLSEVIDAVGTRAADIERYLRYWNN